MMAGHAIAALIAILLVAATVGLMAVDYFRTKAKRLAEAAAKVELCTTKKDEETRHLEREVDAKLEEMETLKGLSGIQSVTGAQVRAAIAASAKGTHGIRPSDSQISRDFMQKADEVMRLSKRAARG